MFLISKKPSRLSFLLLLSIGVTQILAMNAKPEKDHEKFLFETYNLLDNDHEEFKSRFADDAEIRLCYGGMEDNEQMKGCWEGTFDDIFGPILKAVKKSQWSGRWMSTIDDKGGLFFAMMSLETEDGCIARVTSTVYHELNEEGKISKHYGYSDDKGYFVKCMKPTLEALSEGGKAEQ